MMNVYKLTLLSLFSICLFYTSCNGQLRWNLPIEGAAISTGQPKLIKTQTSQEGDNVHFILLDRKGDLWFATTSNGVYRYDGTSFENFTSKSGLKSNCVVSIIEDKKGNIWFGTNSGVSRFDGKTFEHIPLPSTNSD